MICRNFLQLIWLFQPCFPYSKENGRQRLMYWFGEPTHDHQ